MESEKKKKDKDTKLTAAEKAKKDMNAILSKKFMNYPTNSGISGEVFLNKKLFFSNNASKESKFVEEIDDQSQSGYPVKNFMIGPVFGTTDPSTPNAIIQFINKIEPSEKGPQLTQITESDE
jgi:hypothetical protein